MNIEITGNPFAHAAHFAGSKLHAGISGSIACYKMTEIIRAWLKAELHISATLTAGAKEFVTPLLFRSLGAEPVYGEMFTDANVFAHLEPGKNVEAMLIAPASANLISRLANGAASDMLSAQVLAFSGPSAIAPAMNPRMWEAKATQDNISTLSARGWMIIEPDEGIAACGDMGKGRFAPPVDIFLYGLKLLSPQDMSGLQIMVTMGPTREYWDAARFWSNPSSGRMGAALATAAWLRGADVTVICGPSTTVSLPRDIKKINIISAQEMFEQAAKQWPQMDIGFFAAAVADFSPLRPDNAANMKFKKTAHTQPLNIEFARNPDILATLAANRTASQKVLGFAAEATDDLADLLPLAQIKLNDKMADIIVANRINTDGGAFGAEDDSVVVMDRNGHDETWTALSKADIAWELCSWLLKI